jgi:hypothetical protein
MLLTWLPEWTTRLARCLFSATLSQLELRTVGLPMYSRRSQLVLPFNSTLASIGGAFLKPQQRGF